MGESMELVWLGQIWVVSALCLRCEAQRGPSHGAAFPRHAAQQLTMQQQLTPVRPNSAALGFAFPCQRQPLQPAPFKTAHTVNAASTPLS